MEELYTYIQQIEQIKDADDRSLEVFNAASQSIEILRYLGSYENDNKNNQDIFINDPFYKSEEVLESFEQVMQDKYKLDIIRYKQLLTEKEEELMRKDAINQMKSKQTEFILLSTGTILLSFIGFIIFYTTGFYIVHPSLYLVILMMGIGWLATAITSVCTNRRLVK